VYYSDNVLLLLNKYSLENLPSLIIIYVYTIKKIVYYLQFPRGGGTPCHREPHGEALELVRRQREVARNFIVVST
jgi:hypothetical protein